MQSVLRQVHNFFQSEWVLHRMQYSASCFNFQHPFLSLRSYSSFLLRLHRLPITSTFPSVPCSINQSVAHPVRFSLFIACRLFLSSLTLHSTVAFVSLNIVKINRSLLLLCSGFSFPHDATYDWRIIGKTPDIRCKNAVTVIKWSETNVVGTWKLGRRETKPINFAPLFFFSFDQDYYSWRLGSWNLCTPVINCFYDDKRFNDLTS
jgi:hypothetical protein